MFSIIPKAFISPPVPPPPCADNFLRRYTRYGPSELYITGSLRDWTVVPDLHKITATTLLINGSDDEAQDVAMWPFFAKITGKVKWVTIEGAAHFTHVDQRVRHMQVVGEFLAMD